MNAEQEENDAGELGKEAVAMVLSGLLEKLFSATLVGPVCSQIGLTIGDQVKYFRIRNLVKLNERLDQVLRERNLDNSDLKNLSLSVGFPLLEKASYQDDEFLQQKWANLLVSAMEKSQNENADFSLDVTYVEILHQFSKLDCEVLEFIAENGILGKYKWRMVGHPSERRWDDHLALVKSGGVVLDYSLVQNLGGRSFRW